MKTLAAVLAASLLCAVSLVAQTDFRKPLVLDQAVASQFNWRLAAYVKSTAGASGVITFNSSYVVLPDSTQYTPWQPGLPVTIFDGAATETVTLSTVSCSSLSAQPCTATAGFAFAHNADLQVASGTEGLQEAVNLVASHGGGIVVADPSWTGSTAQIGALQGSASVLVEDTRSGAQAWYGWSGSTYVRQLSVSSSSVSASSLAVAALSAGNCVQAGSGGVLTTIAGACGTPSGGSITLQTNSANNASQTALNLENGSGITLANPLNGDVTVSLNSNIPDFSGVITAGDCAQWSSSGVLSDAGAACGGSGGGTVTSVGLSLPTVFNVSGSPITSSGTLAASWANQSANQIFAGPSSGAAAAPLFRALVSADLPAINLSASGNGGVSGLLPLSSGGIGLNAIAAGDLLAGNGASAPNLVSAGAAGQVLISNGAGNPPAFADPIVSRAYVTLFNAQSAAATATSAAVRLPTFAAYGVLSVVGSAIAGSPAGCQLALELQQASGGSSSSAIASYSFTPADSYQADFINPNIAAGDSLLAVYTCSTYPSAGTLTVGWNSLSFAVTNLAEQAGVSLGAPTAWGTAPSGNVIGVNSAVLPTSSLAQSPALFTTASLAAAATVDPAAGNLYWYTVQNVGASVCYLEFFNAASAGVALGTTAPIFTLALPATSSNSWSANSPSTSAALFNFSAALSAAAVTAAGGATACAANSVLLNAGYK